MQAGTEWTGKKSYWLEEREEVGDGRPEGSLAIWDGVQVAVSLMPDVNGTVSRSLLNSILSTLLNKILQWCFGSSFIFLVIDDRVALYCILNGCCNLCVPYCIQVLWLKTNSAPQIKKIPCHFLHHESLSSSVSSSSLCLSSSFLWASKSIRSSLVSSLCCTAKVLYSKIHKSTIPCRWCTCVAMYTRHVN